MPTIPPLFENGESVVDYSTKAETFNNYFDSSIVNPLLIIFETCIREGIFPDMWKMSNVCPIHKKESKNLKDLFHFQSLAKCLKKCYPIPYMIISSIIIY